MPFRSLYRKDPSVKRLLVSLAALSSLSACGMFTNVPAQIFVASVKPASLSYQKADADGFREVKIEAPEVTIQGEPGSIGATLTTMAVRYYKPDGKTALDASKVSAVNTFLTIHVPTSNFPSAVGGNPMDVTQTGKMVNVGSVTTQVPVVNRHIEDYGKDLGEYANATLTAEVKWTGTDDAGFSVELLFHVPITFHGPAGSGK